MTTSKTATGPDDRATAPAARPRLPLWTAAVVGVAGIAFAVAVGQLAGGFLGDGAAPFRAVANQVRDRSPDAVVEWAKQHLGTSDKLVAQAGVVAALLVLGVLAGLFSRRAVWPGVGMAVVLGLAAIGAVLQQPGLARFGVLAPVSSLVAGVAAFAVLHRLAVVSWRSQGRGQDPAGGASRRKFLLASGGALVGAGAMTVLGERLLDSVDVEGSRAAVGRLIPATPAPPVPAGADFATLGTPTFLTANRDFYRIDTAFTLPRIRAEDWSLRIHGMVDHEVTLSYADLRSRPLVERVITMTCVSNEVGGNLVSTARFVGVPVHELLAEAGVRPGAQQVYSTSQDGWTCSTPLEALQDEDRMGLLALGMNGEPLPVEHGFPVRMVVPGLYGFVSATKWLVDLEVTSYAARHAYWTQRGWAEQAPIKTESRIDVPRGLSTVQAGDVTLAGTAWAQNTGIAAVEVRINGGAWQQARLSAELTDQTWRMWRLTVNLRPGSYRAEVRATDRSGYTQTERRAEPIPDGASGWHSLVFTAT